MGVKYIIYDLVDASAQDYRNIKKKIDVVYPNNIHPFNSTYYVATEDSCKEVYTKIERAFLGSSFKLIVGIHSGSFSSENLEISNWLKKHR